MNRRALGETGLQVTELGIGCGSLSKRAREVGVAAIRRALDLGVNFFDCAPLYGRTESEIRLGLGLKGHPRAADCVVATKIGYVPEDFDFSFDATLRSVHASLERLGLERLSLIQVHEIREETWEAVMRPGGALAALRRLQTEGLVEHVGVTGSELPWVKRAIDTGEFETLLIWHHYHLMDREAGEDVLPAAAARGMGIIMGSPYAGAILASGAVPGASYMYRPALEERHAQARQLQAVCERHGTTLIAAALQFCLRAPSASSVVPGVSRPESVDAAYAAYHEPIPEALWPDLRAPESAT